MFDVAKDKSCLGDPESQHRLLTPKFDTNIGTWNVRILHQKSRLEQFMREICRYKWDIIGLAETRWVSTDTKTVNGYDIIFSGHDSKHSGGVALLLSEKARQATIAVQPISDRLLYERFQGHGFNLSVIQVYAPTTDSTDSVIDEFYVKL